MSGKACFINERPTGKGSRLLQAIFDFKTELVLLISENDFPEIKQIELKWSQKNRELENQFSAESPMFKQLVDKLDENYRPTAEEKTFMDGPMWKAWTDTYYGEEQEKKAAKKIIAQRIKSGNMTMSDVKALERAEFHIWPTHASFYGKPSDGSSGDLPVITFDATYYEVLNHYWGNFGDDVVQRFREHLERLGYGVEPNNYSVWDVYKL